MEQKPRLTLLTFCTVRVGASGFLKYKEIANHITCSVFILDLSQA